MRRELCAVCGLPVFLAEKLVIARSPYHRTCFRCARCHNQLTPGNYYETEEGQFCCETCPDEELLQRPSAKSSIEQSEYQQSVDRPLSDEEKSSLGRNATLQEFRRDSVPEQVTQKQRMRLDLMTNHLLSEKMDELSVVDGISAEEVDSEEDLPESSTTVLPSSPRDEKDEDVELVKSSTLEIIEIRRHDNQHHTAISSHDVKDKSLAVKEDTKEALEDRPKVRPLSLVQQRLKMFECQKSEDQPVTSSKQSEALELSNSSKVSLEEEICDAIPLSQMANDFENEDEPPRREITTEDDLSTTKDVDFSDDEEYPEALNPFNDEDSVLRRESTNPFSSDGESDGEDVGPPQPAARSNIPSTSMHLVTDTPTKRVLEAPQINLNPFWSDEEEQNSDSDVKDSTKPIAVPVPKPRTVKQTQETNMSQQKLELNRSSMYASNTSITSSGSTTTSTTPGGSYRKKKPAPQPPTPNKGPCISNKATTSPIKSLNSSTLSTGGSPRTTPRTRKTKPAPPPPMLTSTHSTMSQVTPLTIDDPSIKFIDDTRDTSKLNAWTDEKLNKDEANRNRQSLTSVESPPYMSFPDKSVEGKWKRKKGPAPPRPVPHRRKIKVMSIKDLKLELDEIELQQQGLEKQGVRLEQIIRDKCESGPTSEDANLGVDVEELVLELFALVNEKNELFRRQAELMLLRRQYRLEEEHADVEYQIRCLMCQPEATKTDFDKQREEALIQRLVEIVERRNEIVECLEMDRRREVEEDRSIHKQMGIFAAKNKGGIVDDNNETIHIQKTKKNKFKNKFKEKKLKKGHKEDADKDVDEAEIKLKRHIKRKWF